MKAAKWIQLFFTIPIVIISLIVGINFIVDPYSITSYNILNISNKFARDDRVEKVLKLKEDKAYDNIILGSSRVYSSNPLMVSHYLGGRSYNAGVGTAQIEDHLGFLLLLKRIHKLPKNLIIGLDFYTFNEEVETNKYFAKNKDLNFMQGDVSQESYSANFLSIDAFRASYKTIKNHYFIGGSKPRFDTYGSANNASSVFSFTLDPNVKAKLYSKAELLKELEFVKTLHYKTISKKRLEYLKKIVDICAKNKIKLYLFLTPFYGGFITEIEKDVTLKNQLSKLKAIIAHSAPFYDFTLHNSINDNAAYFTNATHTNAVAGNLIYARIFGDTTVSLPRNFGRYVTQKRQYIKPLAK